jgi:hypothetical protein
MAQTVASRSAAVERMAADWQLAADLLGGTRAMRAAGKRHLPQWPNEEAKSYENRLASAVLFPAYSRTVATLTGKPFSKPLALSDDAPPQVSEWMQDADREGRNLHAFAADCMQTALGYGLGGILVEYPVVRREPGARPMTQAEEAAQQLRPYLVQIKAGQILGWRTERRNGATVLTQLRLLEVAHEQDGAWGTASIEQVRVLTPGKWEIWRRPDGKEWQDATLHDSGVTTLTVIPFIPFYGERAGFMEGRPPLVEVAHLNVAHWQSASDQQTVLHVARVPILFAKMLGDGVALTIGASNGVNATTPDADMKWVEHSGAAINAGKEDLAAIEERMRQAGAELLVIKPGQVTATQTGVENAVGMCALQRITLDLQDALNAAFDLVALYARLPTAGTVTIFNDFGVSSLAEASAELLLKATDSGYVSAETFRGEMRRRGVLGAEVDETEEVSRLTEQGPALGRIVDPNLSGGGGGGQ